MEKFHTIGSLEFFLAWGDQPILELLEEIVDLESIVYNRRRQAIVNKTHKGRRVDVDSVVLCTTEETLFDIRRVKLNKLLSTGVAILHATIDKEKFEESGVEDIKKEIASLKDKVVYYKGAHDAMTKFIEDVLEDDKLNDQIKKYFKVKMVDL